MNIIYNFQVCEKYHNTRTKALYNTICKEIQNRNEKFYLISGFNQFDDIPVLKLSETDDYHSAIEKTLQCFLYHKNNNTDFDFIFFGDDDTFINLNNLENFTRTIDKNKLAIYGSVHYMWFRQDDNKNKLFCTGGPGFIMNKKTFDVVTNSIEKYKIRDMYHSDVSLAFNIHKYNSENNEKIEFINVPGFEQDHRFIFENEKIQKSKYNKIITYHLREWLINVDDYNDVIKIYNKINTYPKNNYLVNNNKLTILSAFFHDLDVTEILRNNITDNKLNMNVNNVLFGDPCPNLLKTLKVKYKYNNINKKVNITEGDNIILPTIDNLEILFAEYENNNVTEILKDKVENDQLSIKVCNEIFGDSIQNLKKTLYVEYMYKNKMNYIDVDENHILHIPEKKIDYIISSNINFYEKTLPVLIPTLLNSGIDSSNIKIYVGGSEKEYIDSYLNCYIKFVKHNSFDYTSFIEYINEDWSSDFVFSLHDTCKVENFFKEKVENFDINLDICCPTKAHIGVCNFGMYKKDFLKKNYDEIKKLENCNKKEAISYEGFLLKYTNKIDFYPNDNYRNMLNTYFVFDNTTFDGINRKVEYFENIGLYKYKANWGLLNKINLNVTLL